MTETLNYDPSDPDAPEFSEDEQNSLEIADKLGQEESELYAGKFENAEELENAYLELQKKLGAPDDDDEVEDTTLDEDEITKFARDHKILYQDLADLSKKEQVVELIKNEIQLMNEKLPSYETIKKFKVLEQDFDQDKDELTPTFKVKRKVVIDNYKVLLDSMY